MPRGEDCGEIEQTKGAELTLSAIMVASDEGWVGNGMKGDSCLRGWFILKLSGTFCIPCRRLEALASLALVALVALGEVEEARNSFPDTFCNFHSSLAWRAWSLLARMNEGGVLAMSGKKRLLVPSTQLPTLDFSSSSTSTFSSPFSSSEHMAD